MDLAKVTNWFRNLRQTSRKRKPKWSDDENENDWAHSASVSRAETPSPSSSLLGQDYDRYGDDMQVDEDEDYDMHTDDEDDEAPEAVTPSSGHSPAPPRSVLVAAPRWSIKKSSSSPYSREEAESDHGVRFEDALLLLGFHQHVAA